MSEREKAVEAAETQMSDHVARFWQLLKTEHVRILVDLRREICTDTPDGPVIYWDGASFGNDVAKALIIDRSNLPHVPDGWQLVEAEKIVDAACAEMRSTNHGVGGFNFDILHKHIAAALTASPPLPTAQSQVHERDTPGADVA